MSFFASLMVDAVLPSSLRTALGLTGDTGSVYQGRSFERIPRGSEVWVESLPVESVGDGVKNVTAHPVVLHIKVRKTQTGVQSGTAQLTTIRAHLDTVRDTYDGLQPLTALTTCFTIKVEGQDVDEDEDTPGELVGTTQLTFYVIGQG